MPPPRPKRFFRIRRKADGWLFKLRENRFMERGSRLKEQHLFRTLQQLARMVDLTTVEVLRYDVTEHPPRPAADLLKKLEEHEAKGWPLF